MRIILDIQGAQSASMHRGVGRYTLSLSKAIAKNRGNHEVFIVLSGAFSETIDRLRCEFESILPRDNIFVFYVPENISYISGNNNRRKVAEILREAFISSLKPDIVHIFSMFEGMADDAVTSILSVHSDLIFSVSLYDFIPLIYPGELSSHCLATKWYNEKLEYFKKADVFLAISNYAKEEGIKYGKLNTNKIVNVSSAVDDKFTKLNLTEIEIQVIKHKYGITKPFILYSGGVEELKNIKNLILAYAKLNVKLRDAFQLFIVCGNNPEILKELTNFAYNNGIKKDEIILTGYISDGDLIILYNLCHLFVFPSLHESFGLTVLEAMSCGASVLSSNTSSLPEVVGLDEALFDPKDVDAIHAKIEQALIDTEFYERLKCHGKSQTSKFSWDKSAINVIATFEKIMQNKINKHQKLSEDEVLDHIAKYAVMEGDKLPLESIARCFADNLLTFKKEKTIFVDISMVVAYDNKTGIQRVTRSILKNLLANPPDGYKIEPIYAKSGFNGYLYAKKFISSFMGTDYDDNDSEFLIDPAPNDIFLGLDWCPDVVADHIKYLRYMRDKGIKVYFVLHDILPITMPDKFLAGMGVHFKAWLESISEFDGAICVSNFVAEEFRIWQCQNGILTKPGYKIGFFHHSGDISDSLPSKGLPSDIDSILTNLGSRITFLSVSTVEPRKGYSDALNAMDKLWSNGHDINYVIVGKKGWHVDDLCKKIENHHEFGKRLFWFKGISDEFLEKLYDIANVVLMASVGEGFGLSIVEAARHGKPVILRDIPVFGEIAGDHGFYFKDDLAYSINEWLKLYEKNEHPKTEGMKLLSWNDSTKMLLDNIL